MTQLDGLDVRAVHVHAGKISRSNPGKEPPHSNIKRAEVNFIPNLPQGEDPSSRIQAI